MSTATVKRHPEVPYSRVPLGERQAETQISKGLFTVERGEPFPIPVDRLGEPTQFLHRTLWQRSPLPQSCPDHPDGIVSNGRCRPRASTAPTVMASILGHLGIDAGDAIQRHSKVFGSKDCLWTPDMTEMVVHRAGVQFRAPSTVFHGRVLRELRERNADIPAMYYQATLGHDLHVSTWGNLFARHWHTGWADPFTGETTSSLDPTFATLRTTHFVAHECDLPVCPQAIWGTWDKALLALSSRRGFVEVCGWISGGKVTDAFVSEEISELVSSAGSEYADFDFHEVGTSAQAEDNNDTALIITSSITRVSGTPTDSDPIYQNVGSITADTTETWEEHGLFNNLTSVALMDRSLTGGQSVNNLDVVEYTYQLTKNPEA